jgi:hypothetical protein
MVGPALWPRSWVGTWVAADGKTISISWGTQGAAVTVRSGPGQAPCRSHELLGGGTKMIEDLPARCELDEQGRRYLEVEAGTPTVGATYRLYPAIEDAAGFRSAGDDVNVEQLLLVPNTAIGLYDDYDDDLGVSWAIPLQPLRWASV